MKPLTVNRTPCARKAGDSSQTRLSKGCLPRALGSGAAALALPAARPFPGLRVASVNELALLQGWTPHRPTSPGSAASRASVWPPFNQSGRPTGKSDVSSAANLSLRDSLGPHAAPPHLSPAGPTCAECNAHRSLTVRHRAAPNSPRAPSGSVTVSVSTVLWHLPLPWPVRAGVAIRSLSVTVGTLSYLMMSQRQATKPGEVDGGRQH